MIGMVTDQCIWRLLWYMTSLISADMSSDLVTIKIKNGMPWSEWSTSQFATYLGQTLWRIIIFLNRLWSSFRNLVAWTTRLSLHFKHNQGNSENQNENICSNVAVELFQSSTIQTWSERGRSHPRRNKRSKKEAYVFLRSTMSHISLKVHEKNKMQKEPHKNTFCHSMNRLIGQLLWTPSFMSHSLRERLTTCLHKIWERRRYHGSASRNSEMQEMISSPFTLNEARNTEVIITSRSRSHYMSRFKHGASYTRVMRNFETFCTITMKTSSPKLYKTKINCISALEPNVKYFTKDITEGYASFTSFRCTPLTYVDICM